MLLQNGDRIVFTGDSITDCGRAYPIGEDSFGGLGTGYVNMMHSLINAFYPEITIRITNTGISGNNILHLESRWETDVMDLKPDWVSVMIGINDVWRQFNSSDLYDMHITPEVYESKYRRLIERTLPQVKGMILATPYYMEPNRSDWMRKRMDEYGAIVKKLSEEYGLCFINVQEAFDSYLDIRHTTSISMDRIHPNQIGSVLIARKFLMDMGFNRIFK